MNFHAINNRLSSNEIIHMHRAIYAIGSFADSGSYLGNKNSVQFLFYALLQCYKMTNQNQQVSDKKKCIQNGKGKKFFNKINID